MTELRWQVRPLMAVDPFDGPYQIGQREVLQFRDTGWVTDFDDAGIYNQMGHYELSEWKDVPRSIVENSNDEYEISG